MVVIESSSVVAFTRDGVHYPKCKYRIIEHDDLIGLNEIGEYRVQIVEPTRFDEWQVDGNNFASSADLITALRDIIFI